jgi:hypothetical protein
MRDHACDEHESLKLFSSDLEGMKLEDEGYEDKLHQLMEVSWQSVCICVFTQRGELVGKSVGDGIRTCGYACR